MNNNNNTINNLMNNLDIIDIISVISFIAQMKNIKGDEENQNRAKMIVQAIATEVQQFHIEQEQIVQELKEIKKLLQERR